MYWSPSTCAFYDSPAGYSNFPSDAVTIPDSLYSAVVLNRPAGKYVVSDKNGMPTLADSPAMTLAQSQALQANVLSGECQAAITSGFTSDALGKPNYYGSLQTDQLNLQRLFAASQSGSPRSSYPIYCSPTPMQNPPLVQHTQPQMIQVIADMNAWITAQQEKYAALVQQVQTAKTVADVQKVAWPS